MRIQPDEAISRLKKLGVKGTRKVPASTPIKFVRGFGDNEHHTIYFLGQGNRVFITPADKVSGELFCNNATNDTFAIGNDIQSENR